MWPMPRHPPRPHPHPHPQRRPVEILGATIRPRKPYSSIPTIIIIGPVGAWLWAVDRRTNGILPKRFCIR